MQTTGFGNYNKLEFDDPILNYWEHIFKEKSILRDKDEKKFKNEIKRNTKIATDIVITSGAVSAGKFDFVPKIVSDFKLIKKFKGVSIRPGKPIMFAKFKKNMVFFGLPGNPISSAACFRFFY